MRLALPVGLFALGLAVWLGRNRKAAAAVSGGQMSRADVRAIIWRLNATEFAGWFDPLDVEAIAEIESSFIPTATRAEAHLGDASIGLMQTLLSTARDRGFTGSAEGLFDPETSLRIGMRQLQWSWNYLRSRLNGDPSKEQWVGSYNAGVGNVLRGYIPVAYITKFAGARERAGDA